MLRKPAGKKRRNDDAETPVEGRDRVGTGNRENIRWLYLSYPFYGQGGQGILGYPTSDEQSIEGGR
jgi:hypothetical protein